MKRLQAATRLLPDLALAALCLGLALRFLVLLLTPQAPLAARPVDALPAVPADPLAARTAALIEAAPFGMAEAPGSAGNHAGETLTLAGVMLAEVEADSRAILTFPDGDQRAFGVADPLPDGRRVSRVRADAVVLEGPSGRSVLPLRPDAVADATGDAAAATPVSDAPKASARKGMVLDKRTHESSRRFLAELRRDATRDPSVLARLADIESVTEGPTPGFRVHSRNSAALLARLGLESGDLVTEVNGISLDGPLAGLAAADELAAAEELTVQLVRNGAPVTVKLRVGDVPP